MIDVKSYRINTEFSENRSWGLGILGERHRVGSNWNCVERDYCLRKRSISEGHRQKITTQRANRVHEEGVQMLYDWQERQGNQYGLFRTRLDCDKQGCKINK